MTILPINVGISNTLGAPLGLPPGVPQQTYLNKTSAPPPPEIPGKNLKRALCYLADYGGCGYYRCMAPNFLLNLNEKAVVVESTAMIFDARFYETIEVVKFQ